MSATPRVNSADGAASLEAQRSSPPLSRKSASSTSSFKSVLSQIKMKNLSLEEQLGNLESEFSRREQTIMDEQDNLIDCWEATDDALEKEKIKKKINRLEEKLARATNIYQRDKAGLERSLAASKQMEKLEEDNEQRLDSGDEEIIRERDAAINDKPTLPVPIKEAEMSANAQVNNTEVISEGATIKNETAPPMPDPEPPKIVAIQVPKSEEIIPKRDAAREYQNPPTHPVLCSAKTPKAVVVQVEKSEVNVAGKMWTRQTAKNPAPPLSSQSTADYCDSEDEETEKCNAQKDRYYRLQQELDRKQQQLLKQQAEWQRIQQAQQQHEESMRLAYRDREEEQRRWREDLQRREQREQTRMEHNPPEQTNVTVELLTQALGNLGNVFGNRGSSWDKRLPEFNGSPSQWGTFKSTYERTTKDFRISDGENMARLQAALKGEARDVVQHLLANVLNVPAILTTLEDRFGRPEYVLNYLVKNAKRLRAPDPAKPSTVVDFAIAIEALLTNVSSFNRPDYLYNTQLVNELVMKCPLSLKEKWYSWLVESGRIGYLKTFQEWISTQKKIAQLQIQPTHIFDEKREERKPNNKRSLGIHAAVKDKPTKGNCQCCDKSFHSIANCFKFEKMEHREKKALVREKELCFMCLKKGHRFSECRNPKPCEVTHCKKPSSHHTLLHFKSEETEDKLQTPRSTSPVKEISTASSRQNILPIIPVYLKGPYGKMKVNALLDSGSSFCALEQEVADKLGLEGVKQTLTYTVFGGKRQEESQEVSLDISGFYDRAPYYKLKRVSTVKAMKLAPRSLDANELKRKFPHLNRMKLKSLKDARPQLILGSNVGGLFAAREILESEPGEVPAAVRSLLGWYLIEDEDTAEKCIQFALKDQEMHDDIREFIALENLGVKELPSVRSKEDEQALVIMEANTRKEGNRWITSLPWRNEEECLPPSREMALNRLFSMEKKMDKDPEFTKLCQEKFNEYIEKGFLKKVNNKKINEKKQWYLPWFFAMHPNKKPRLVFDAAAKSFGKSLNDFLLTGPDFLRPLYSVLIRFRTHQIALTADVQAMFHQVALDEKDHPSQTVLFRGKRRTGAPDEYQMSVLFFGAASSPSLACFTRIRNAKEYEQKYPEAVKAAILDTYMDDCLTGAETIEDATRLQQELSLIHESGGFPLVKWTSSSQEVVSEIPEAMRAEGAIKLQNKDEENWEKTLGMLWNPDTDEFSFSLSKERISEEYLHCSKIPTKRKVASIVMSLFDPLGFLSSLKIKGLLIIQNIWRSGISWDDEIPQSLHEPWRNWMEEVKEAVHIRIPRKLCPVSLQSLKSVQLHVFCDASEEAYACAAYLRLDTGGSVMTPFVMGKVRVGPMKELTIPRMELNAALIGTRVAKAVKESFGDDLKLDKEIFWSDSRTVLAWVRSVDKRYKAYVANRVGEILENSDSSSWRWVPTSDNVADDATRSTQGGTTSESRWLQGPAFLKQPECDWPKEKEEEPVSEYLEEKSIQVAVKESKEDLYLPSKESYSSWYRLIRSTAARFPAMRKFLSIRGHRFKGSFRIKSADIKKAEDIWIKRHQEEYFNEELNALRANGMVNKTSRILKLSPGLNPQGLIVVKGRLENSDMGATEKQPPILDPSDWYVVLMIRWFHEIGQHFGQERIINELRKKAWILNVRGAVKKCKTQCLICVRNSTEPIPPEMGQLPVCRVEGKQPFFHTGVDYFGPMVVKSGRKTLKRWGVLFTCLAIRAVHLELAESLESSEFLSCLARFINLRGAPGHIWSDNGTNFVGAEREMGENLRRWNQDEIRGKLSVRGTEWHFIPPASPHMGGSWERLIRTTKRILRNILHEETPTDSTLRTLLTEVTSIMNSRPLTVVSSDPQDGLCLTPNDILQVKTVIGPSIPGIYDEQDRFRNSWRKGQALAKEFWKRWSAEYLPWLLTRNKWHDKTRRLNIGDTVLVLEENAPRNAWKKGLVTNIFPGKDGQVRAAEVKVARVDHNDKNKIVKISYLKRPVVKLCPLVIKD